MVKFIRKGDPGAPGENGISVSLLPGTLAPIVGKKNVDMRIQVALYDGGRLVPYNDKNDGNMLCSVLPDELPGVESYKWGFQTDEYNRFFYQIWIIPTDTEPIRIPIYVTYKEKHYEQVICINPVANGSQGDQGQRGASLRGPLSWSDCPLGFVFESGADGEQFLDIVEHNGYYYMCQKSHNKMANNAPGSVLDTSNGLWRLAQNLPFVASKILLSQYALVKNLGVEAIEMKDNLGNVVFRAKGGAVQCNTGNFRNINVAGDSHFGGTLDGATGSFKSLDCVNENGDVAATMSFEAVGNDAFFQFLNGNLSHQGSRNGRNLIFRTSDVWCRSAFGHAGCTFTVVTDDYMSVYSSKKDGQYVALQRSVPLRKGTGDWYYIPMYGGPSTFENASGMPIDVVIIKSVGKWHYTFEPSTMKCGKSWRVINPLHAGNEIYICEEGNWRRINGGKSALCTFVDFLFCDPSISDEVVGKGIFVIG